MPTVYLTVFEEILCKLSQNARVIVNTEEGYRVMEHFYVHFYSRYVVYVSETETR